MKSLSCPSFAVSAPWFMMASFGFALFSFQLWQSGWNNYLRYRPEQQKCESWISAGGRPWLGIKTNGEMCLGIFFFPLLFFLWLWAPEDGLCIPLGSVSPISSWQEVISGGGEAADRTEFGIWHFVPFEHSLIFVFPCTPRPSSLYQSFVLHLLAWVERDFFYILNDTFELISSN